MFITPYHNNNQEIFIATSVKNELKNESAKVISAEFFEEIEIDINSSVFMEQSHSVNIFKIDEKSYREYNYKNSNFPKDTDALITNMKSIPIVVKTADCLPVVIFCKKSKSAAVVHAGWKGIVQEIIPKTIKEMQKEYKAEIKSMYVYLGVRIAKENYEVKDEFSKMFISRECINAKWYVDIGKEAKLQVLKLGIEESNIEDSLLNSYSNKFYSYRRDGNKKGRILTVAVIK